MTRFAAILNVLADARVKFVLIGGYAAMLHGSTYLTRDLDICYERTAGNLDRLATALAALHPRLRGAPEGVSLVLDARALRQGMNFTLETDAGDLDLLGELTEVGTYSNVIGNADTVELSGRLIHVISLDELIRSKRAAARPKDLNVLPELEALQELKERGKKGDRWE
jgi:predicted nucleotidyltransferase